MAATVWDDSVRTSIADRAQRVSADAKAGWGKLNARGMMAHINDSLRMALGDLPVKSKNLPLRYKPIRKLFIYYLPIPKSAPTAPEHRALRDRGPRGREENVRGINESPWRR